MHPINHCFYYVEISKHDMVASCHSSLVKLIYGMRLISNINNHKNNAKIKIQVRLISVR